MGTHFVDSTSFVTDTQRQTNVVKAESWFFVVPLFLAALPFDNDPQPCRRCHMHVRYCVTACACALYKTTCDNLHTRSSVHKQRLRIAHTTEQN